MAAQQRQQISPSFYDQQQSPMMTSNQFYAQQLNMYMGMQQQYIPYALPPQQNYRLPEIQV
jgi:hypothetical protein